MFLCRKKKKPLTVFDFRGKGITSYNKKYDIICYKCNANIENNNINIRLAKIMNEHYYFCSDFCWSRWCSKFNKFV